MRGGGQERLLETRGKMKRLQTRQDKEQQGKEGRCREARCGWTRSGVQGATCKVKMTRDGRSMGQEKTSAKRWARTGVKGQKVTGQGASERRAVGQRGQERQGKEQQDE